VTKAQLYAEHGVQHFWLLDPAERILEAFELSGGLWTRIGSYDDTATVRVKPFEAIELRVGAPFPPKQ
jgi:Uma2 family endonuclease